MTSDKLEKGSVEEVDIGSEEGKSIKDPSDTDETQDSTSTADKSDLEDEWQDLLGSGSILKKILKEGTDGTKPQRLNKLVINYTLNLDDGTHIETKDNFELQLSDSEVVQGLDVALGLMNVNERCLLKIEPRLAFGTVGLKPNIPGNAKVVYDVELVSVSAQEDVDTLTILDRKLRGNKKRETGNWWYGRGEHTIAIQCYRRALDFLDEVDTPMGYEQDSSKTSAEVSDTTLQSLLEDRISVCNNMAAAQIKLELYDPALSSLQIVLRCQPNNVKALFRKAKVHKAKNDPHAALQCLKKAIEIEPNNTDIQNEISNINLLIKKQKASERDMARRMFKGNPKPERKGSSTTKSVKNKYLIWSATIAASVAVGLVGVAVYRLKFV